MTSPGLLQPVISAPPVYGRCDAIPVPSAGRKLSESRATAAVGDIAKMRRFLTFGYSLGFGLAIVLSAELAGRAAEPSAAEVDFFEKEVRALLVEECGGCHGDVRPKGKLKLTSRGSILKGGDNGAA